jgi:integrase
MAGRVRKRVQRYPNGKIHTSFLAPYKDQSGKWRARSFQTKREADAWLAQTKVDVKTGLHTPDAASITVAAAAELWLQRKQLEKVEKTTLLHYRYQAYRHIIPLLGNKKLSRLTRADVEQLRDTLLATLSRTTVQYNLRCLKGIIGEAQRLQRVAQNVAAAVRLPLSPRSKRKLEVGKDIPSPEEIQLMLQHAKGRSRVFLLMAVCTGMRLSELLGLTWENVDLRQGKVHVRQRMDALGQMGPTKSQAGQREIPLSDVLVLALREWRLACPKGKLDLVFPNRRGEYADQPYTPHRDFHPLQEAAGLLRPEGELQRLPQRSTGYVRQGKYKFHSLRHFAASAWINEGLPPKQIQELMGHASITITFDRYGHLFPKTEELRKAMSQIAVRLLGK